MAINTTVEKPVERDILSVMRELDAGTPAETAAPNSPPPAMPDPRDLLTSLRKKAELVQLLDGHAEAKDVVAMKQDLHEAIDFLEGLIRGPKPTGRK